jgi:hypothetical protein
VFIDSKWLLGRRVAVVYMNHHVIVANYRVYCASSLTSVREFERLEGSVLTKLLKSYLINKFQLLLY